MKHRKESALKGLNARQAPDFRSMTAHSQSVRPRKAVVNALLKDPSNFSGRGRMRRRAYRQDLVGEAETNPAPPAKVT
jgi:hypothetical protein